MPTRWPKQYHRPAVWVLFMLFVVAEAAVAAGLCGGSWFAQAPSPRAALVRPLRCTEDRSFLRECATAPGDLDAIDKKSRGSMQESEKRDTRQLC
jgi:hypothetical protein